MNFFSAIPRAIPTTLTCLGLLATLGCNENVDMRQTHVVQGLIYKLNADDPFSGTLTSVPMIELGYPINGQCEAKVTNGLLEGTTNCSLPAGKVVEVNFAGGKRNGTEKIWSNDAKFLLSMTEWKNALRDGVEEQYGETGKLIRKTMWASGQKEGAEQAWDITGSTLTTDLNWTSGKETGFKHEGDDEFNLKNGQLDGVQKKYATDAKTGKRFLSSEKTYMHNKLQGKATTWDENGNIVLLQSAKNGIIQSQLKQKWLNGKVIETESAVNISPDGKDDQSIAIRKDGLEHAFRNIVTDSHAIEIEEKIIWVKGKPTTGQFEERRSGKVIAMYDGITNPDDDRILVKNGVEKRWNEAGNLILEANWVKGDLVKVDRPMGGIENPAVDQSQAISQPSSVIAVDGMARTYL